MTRRGLIGLLMPQQATLTSLRQRRDVFTDLSSHYMLGGQPYGEVLVFLNGVLQNSGPDYSIVQRVLTFTNGQPSDGSVIQVLYWSVL